MKKVIKSIFTVSLYLPVVQQFPIIRNSYNEIRLVIYLLYTIMLIGVVFSKLKGKISKKILLFTVFVVYSVLIVTLSSVIGNPETIAIDVLVPFGVIVISNYVSFSDKEMKILLRRYIVLSTVLGLSIIFYYGSGFTITQNYFFSSKNQLGPFLGYSAVLSILSYLKTKNIISLLLAIGNFVSIVVLRNRSGLVAIIIVVILILMQWVKQNIRDLRKMLILTAITIITIIAFSNTIESVFDIIFKSLTLNYDVSSLESLTAGRFDVYRESIDVILNNPLSGQMFMVEKLLTKTPHNYLLNIVLSYGFVFSFPFVAVYFYLWFFSLSKIKNQDTIGYVLLFGLIVSLFEYTYPYGPGTTQMLLWVLFSKEVFKNEKKIN